MMGNKLSDLSIHTGACGPFVLSGAGGYRQVQTPKGRLFAFDTEGQHVLTCSQNGGLVYKVIKGVFMLVSHRIILQIIESRKFTYTWCTFNLF